SPGSAPSTTRCACMQRSGTSPPTTSITAAARGSAAPAPPGCDAPGPSGSSRIEPARDDHRRAHRSRDPLPGEEGRFWGCRPPSRTPAEPATDDASELAPYTYQHAPPQPPGLT